MTEARADDMHAKAQIAEVMCTYAHAIDSRDFDLLASCFTEDMRWTVTGTKIEREDLGTFLERQGPVLGRFRLTQHMMSTPRISLDEREASGVFYALATHIMLADGKRVTVGVRYDETFAHADGRWRIRSHVVTSLWSDDDGKMLRGLRD
jgi:ketosteroid isomerase-like protein